MTPETIALLAQLALQYGPVVARGWQQAFASGSAPTEEMWQAMEAAVAKRPEQYLEESRRRLGIAAPAAP